MNKVIDILRTYLPFLIEAGEYSLNIQNRVFAYKNKITEDSTIMSEALTDADLSIQNMFEIVTLSNFSEIDFVPEEIDKSINIKYFPKDSRIRIFLDPINATKFYKDKSGFYDIIITIVQDKKIVGGVTYIPEKKLFYIADEDKSYVVSSTNYRSLKNWEPLKIDHSSSIIMTYRADPNEIELLKNEFESVVQQDKDYNSSSVNYSIHDILTGRIGAYFRRNGSIIDWGVIGYIAQKSGCTFIDYEGRSMQTKSISTPYRAPSMICAYNEKLALKIKEILSIKKC